MNLVETRSIAQCLLRIDRKLDGICVANVTNRQSCQHTKDETCHTVKWSNG